MNREAKLDITKPTPFSGENREEWREFRDSCENIFSAKSRIYSNDVAKIAFAASNMTGPAKRYHQNLMRKQRDGEDVLAFISWSNFVMIFGEMFGLHDEVLHAQSKLDHCTQKWSEAFADFLVRFEDIALLTHYNDRH